VTTRPSESAEERRRRLLRLALELPDPTDDEIASDIASDPDLAPDVTTLRGPHFVRVDAAGRRVRTGEATAQPYSLDVDAVDRTTDEQVEIHRLQDELERHAPVDGDREAAPTPPEPREVRERQGLTVEAFAARYGLAPARVEAWENGERVLDAAAALLLTIIDREPEAAERAVRAARGGETKTGGTGTARPRRAMPGE